MTQPDATLALTARNVSLTELVALLEDHRARRLDVVAPATALRAEQGRLIIPGAEHLLTPDGVTTTPGVYTPTRLCDATLADKLAIPTPYLHRLRDQALDLYDANINGWLRRSTRSYLIRCLRAPHTGGDADGHARAVLSDSYRLIDNLDVLLAALDGIRATRANVTISSCDLSERRMYVRCAAPDITAAAPALLATYRSPFTGQPGRDNPAVAAGWVLSNSETGCGAFTLTPRLTVQICSNGLTITRDALRNIHLGQRLDPGIITWSTDTQARVLDLVTAQTRDAVAAFLTRDYLDLQLHRITGKATHPVRDAENTITRVCTTLRFTAEQQAAILDHFIAGADLTAGGVMHAITSTAQLQPDPDTAHHMETTALRALDLAATH